MRNLVMKGLDTGQSYLPRRKVSAPDVDKLPKLAFPVVAVELGQLLREPALELGTGLVLRSISWQRSRVNFIPADKLTRCRGYLLRAVRRLTLR